MDADTRELLAVYASYYRSNINTMIFLKKAMETCTSKPVVLVDGGPWYPWPLNEMAMKWPHNVRIQERDREVLPGPQAEDEAFLQQSSLVATGQPPILHERLHAMVQPSQEASGTGESPSGGEPILAVSANVPISLKLVW